jgi:DNA-binding transcriptional LysR family regulator
MIAALGKAGCGVTDEAKVLDRFVVASPQYVAVNGEPQHPADLSRHRLLNFGPTGPTWSFEGPEGQIAVTVEPHLTTNDGHMLLEAALVGTGIAVVSSYMASAALARVQLVRLLDAAMPSRNKT